MEIILKEDIIGLGYKNDVVKVKNGYGRNYLIPTGKAVVATVMAKKQLAETLKQQAAKIAARQTEAQKKAEALKDVVVVIPMKVGATGVTYGSVNASTVAEELVNKGFDVDRKIITMHDVKKLGTYEATIHFFKDVEVKVPVQVVPEEKQEKAEKAAPKAEKAAEPEAEKAEASEVGEATAPEAPASAE